ncbi:MAG: ATP-binding cassette domain-containing protein [Acidimicrobiales bacterium]|nr:ATP-binding cassette domain-containing protein [Acidimicrobiales bacterium]
MNDLSVAARVRRDGFELTVELTAAPGEVVGLIGDIGSGKSTVLGLIAGVLRAEEGRVRGPGVVWDEPAASVWVPPEQRSVSYLRQRPQLADDVAAIDQVLAAMAVPNAGNGAAHTARREAMSLLEDLGLHAGVAGRPGWTLSGGEAQRVALAVALAGRASVILLDDPFGAIDSRGGAAVRRWLVDRLARRGRTTIVACADPADTRHLADRVVELP